MKKLLIIFGILILVIVLANALYHSPLNQVKGEYRYKITVNVQTPEGIKSGSTVRLVKDQERKYQMINLPESTSPPSIYGEAVVVDLGAKGKLFGLINSNSYRELFAATPHGTSGSATIEGINYYNSLEVGNKYYLKIKGYWPDFVMFEDLSDPMSVKAVNKENISEQLGAGYSIKNVEIEITDKELKCNILKQVPVFHQQYLAWRKTLDFNDPRKISAANFCMGVE